MIGGCDVNNCRLIGMGMNQGIGMGMSIGMGIFFRTETEIRLNGRS